MTTSPSPISFPAPSSKTRSTNRRNRVADLESQARLVEKLIPKFKNDHDRQFYREVVQSYRAVARDILRKAWSDDKGQDIAEYAVMLALILGASLPDSSSVFYWEKVKFGLKPTLRINQQIAASATGEHGPVDVIAIKQLYASHYFQTALDLNFCVPGTTEGFYLVTLKGSEQAGLTGAKGSMVRKVAIDKTRSSLEKSLAAIRTQLEK